MKHYMTRYVDLADGLEYVESWLQVDAFGRSFCFSKVKKAI